MEAVYLDYVPRHVLVSEEDGEERQELHVVHLYVLEQPAQSSLNGSLRINCSGTAPGWRSLQRLSSTRC